MIHVCTLFYLLVCSSGLYLYVGLVIGSVFPQTTEPVNKEQLHGGSGITDFNVADLECVVPVPATIMQCGDLIKILRLYVYISKTGDYVILPMGNPDGQMMSLC